MSNDTADCLKLESVFVTGDNSNEDQSAIIEQIIFALSGAVEAKDRYTNGHSQRVAIYAREIAKRIGYGEEEQLGFFYAGMLHDIGKIRVSDAIINKNGRLTDEEFAEIKLHTMAGYYILKEVSAISSYAVCARWHHERYDGKGYPNGLSGENIPLPARLIAVADAYDAMTSTRSYRDVLTQEKVRQEIIDGIGTQFDPVFAKVMLEMIDEDKNYEMRQASVVNKNYKIFAIDDDAMVLQLLNFIIRSNPKYQLITASSAQEGYEKLQNDEFDLVLLDVEMPVVDGFEALSWIREHYADLPVIFMTGDKELDIIQKAEKMGISDYLTKPLVVHILWESINNVLSTSRLRNNY